jgi:hypothetical protein
MHTATGTLRPIQIEKVPNSSVGDPDPQPDSYDPYLLGPTGSFHHQAKNVRKPFFSTVLSLLLFIFEE